MIEPLRSRFLTFGAMRRGFVGKALLVALVLAGCRMAVAFVDPPNDPAETKPAETKPGDAKPGDANPSEPSAGDDDLRPGSVACANLVYGNGKTSVCFSPQFLAEVGKQTNIVTRSRFAPVKLESPRLFEFPFAVWTGEGNFQLTPEQRANLRNYLTNGGFIVASAGCSSPEWAQSCRRELDRAFPEVKLTKIDFSHPLFHTVHNIPRLECKKGAGKEAVLEGLEIDGRIVLVYSVDGLNDTANAGSKNCCCCGGNEINNALKINVNLLAYALTH